MYDSASATHIFGASPISTSRPSISQMKKWWEFWGGPNKICEPWMSSLSPSCLMIRYRWLKAPIFTNNGKLQQPGSQQIRFQGFFLARCIRSWLHRSHRWLTASFLDLRWSPRQKTWEHSIFLDWSLHYSYTWNRSCVADHSYLKWRVHKCGTQTSGDRYHFPLSNGNFRGPYNSKWCTSAPLQSPPLWIRRRPWPSGPVFKEWNYGICNKK